MEDFSKYNGDGTNLRKAQLKMLDILIEFDKICRKNNIEYWLDSGTLLGAVRHGGFIPWDDDMDICVMRKDYKKLRKVLQKELPNNLVFVDWKNEKNFFDHCGRIKDNSTCVNNINYAFQDNKGVYLDILIVEEVPSMKVKMFVEKYYGRVFRQLHHFGKVIYKSKLKQYLVYLLALLLSPIAYGSVFLLRIYAKFFSGEKLGFVYAISFPSKRFRSEIFPCVEIEFEGHKFLAPNNFDSYLTHIYGDYMKIPKLEDRQITHEIEIL